MYRKIFSGIFVSILFVAFFVSWKTPTLPKLTSQQWEKLNKGEIIMNKEIKTIDNEKKGIIGAYLIYSQPITDVWNNILHGEKYDTFLPDLSKSTLVSKTDKVITVDFLVKIAFINVRYRVNHFPKPEQFYINWKLEPKYDNDLKYFYGEWQLYPLSGGKTFAKYGAIVNTSSLIPGWIERRLTEKGIPKNMEAFKKWIDSNGTWHK